MKALTLFPSICLFSLFAVTAVSSTLAWLEDDGESPPGARNVEDTTTMIEVVAATIGTGAGTVIIEIGHEATQAIAMLMADQSKPHGTVAATIAHTQEETPRDKLYSETLLVHTTPAMSKDNATTEGVEADL